jgi:hypothetical protein
LRSSFAGGCCLCGTVLELPGLCDRLDQGGELQDEMGEDTHKVWTVTASSSDFGISQGSGNRAKVRAVGRRWWLASVGFASCAVVEVGSAREFSVAGDCCGHV